MGNYIVYYYISTDMAINHPGIRLLGPYQCNSAIRKYSYIVDRGF
jgi:hypothetical protein